MFRDFQISSSLIWALSWLTEMVLNLSSKDLIETLSEILHPAKNLSRSFCFFWITLAWSHRILGTPHRSSLYHTAGGRIGFWTSRDHPQVWGSISWTGGFLTFIWSKICCLRLKWRPLNHEFEISIVGPWIQFKTRHGPGSQDGEKFLCS